MTKILILGAGGMLGLEFCEFFSQKSDFEVLALDKNELDITDQKQLEIHISDFKPDYILNCAAFTNVDLAEEEIESAISINSNAAANLARICRENGVLLVHFSTDYVFDGSKEEFDETDNVNPLNIYGKSKLQGEKEIMDMGGEFYIIRTSWLFGKYGRNFVFLMTELLQKKDFLQVVDDQTASPTYTKDLVSAVFEQFIKPKFSEKPEFGIYHLTNDDKCSRYDLVRYMSELLARDVQISPVSSDFFKTPATRPVYSVLKNTKAKKLRNYREAVKDFLSEIGCI